VAKFREIRHTLKLTTEPTVEPLTPSEIRAWARIDDTFEESEEQRAISAARQLLERQRQVALISQSWTLSLDGFPDWEIELRKGPVTAITSVSYIDSNGDTQTLAASKYKLSSYGFPAILTPSYGNVWPTARDEMDSVTIVFAAGYGTAPASVPAAAKQAIALIAAQWLNETREDVSQRAFSMIPNGFDRLSQFVGWEGYS
jgi:uncharacterized phiE125 gp8 family phage protein